MSARYYDPGTGRFLSEDPIGYQRQDENLYRYVLNNPLVFIDPTGKWLEWLDDGVCHITGRCDPTTPDSDDWSDTIRDVIDDVVDDVFDEDSDNQNACSNV